MRYMRSVLQIGYSVSVLQIPAQQSVVRAASFFREFAVLVVALICLRPAFSQVQKVPIESITSALIAKNYEQAIQLSSEALEEQPSNAQLWTLQAIAFAGKGDKVSALRDFQRSRKIAPDYIAALAGASQILYANEDAKAIPLLKRLLQLRPENPTGHAMLAVLEYRAKNCEAAVPHFEKQQKCWSRSLTHSAHTVSAFWN